MGQNWAFLYCLLTGEGDALPNASCLHLTIAVSGIKHEESVWHWRCLLEVTACGLLQTAEAQLLGFALAFKQVLSSVWGVSLWTRKQVRTVIPFSWYSIYCAARFLASYSIPFQKDCRQEAIT